MDSGLSVVTGPVPGVVSMQIGDAIEGLLPSEAFAKLRELRDKVDEAHVLVRAIADDQQELRLDIIGHQNRIKELQVPRGSGGFGLPDDAPQVIAEQQKLDRKLEDQRRLSGLYEARSSAWSHASELVRNIEQAIATRPRSCIAAMVTIDLPSFKGNVLDAIEGRRRHRHESNVKLSRVRAAPWPSSLAKEKARKRIDQLAEAGRPLVHRAIDHDEDVAFANRTYPVRIANVDPSAIGFVELPDVLALSAFLHRDALLKALEREIDEAADDKAALSLEQRRKAEEQILADLLATEREECALIEAALAEGITVDYRVDCDPRAILGIGWVAAPGQ